MKVRNFFRTKWQYILVFIIPWILILIHSVISGSWPVGEGSILYKDAGNLYVQLYSELWDKVHEGGSLSFSWSSGLGVEFAISVLRYLISPFTLIMMIVPRTAIADMVQILMVLKWSLLSVSMLCYVSHTKHNKLERRRQIMCVAFTMMYFLSNAVISVMYDLSCLDVMIVFPLLLLLTEKMAEDKGFGCFYVLFSLMILMNYELAIPVAIFLIVWFAMQFDKETPCNRCNIVSFLVAYLAAIATGMVVILPNVTSGMDAITSDITSVLSLSEFVQRFFICDSLLIAQSNQPMLYCSMVAVLLSLLYLFTKVPLKKKIVVLVLVLLLCVGQVSGIVNALWNGNTQTSSKFAFLLVFAIMYMAMVTVSELGSTKMWQIIIVGFIGIVGCVWGFFRAPIMLEFYVYLSTVLVVVFTVMMLVFYRKKSIQYQNLLIVLAIICVAELSANAVYQLNIYNEYSLEETYYHQDAENLTKALSLEAGEKVAMVQGMYNYGMKIQVPSASWKHAIGNQEMSDFYQSLGMEWSDEGAAYFGGSPLLNTIFNIRYGLGQNEMPFSDCEQIKSVGEQYNLYEMQRLAGLGYMVDLEIENWDLEKDSPFDIQNDFVKKATGQDEIFEMITPSMNCMSMAGVDPHSEHGHDHKNSSVENSEEKRVHVHGENSEIYYGEYTDNNMYYYHFQKIYADDVVNMTFRSDGVTDYYIYMEGADKSITYVMINGEYVYWDQFASNQKVIHVGVVPEGAGISVISNFEIDGMDYSEVWYQVAGFNEEQYEKVYDVLSANTLQLDNYDDGYIQGQITTESSGMLMTSVPAYSGMSVVVDDEEVEYKSIGGALIGVPLEAGNHEVTIEYHVPYLLQGVVASLIGVVIFVIYCVSVSFVQKKRKIEG